MTSTVVLAVFITLIALSRAVSIGAVNTSRFTSLDQLNQDAVWIDNQSSPGQCLCTVLARFPTALLFNSFTNGSCQLFFALPFTYTMQYHPQSTLILLRPLPPQEQAPCCSNLTWLITRMANSALPNVSQSSPTYLVIDDLDYLAVMSYGDKLYRYNRTTMAQVSSTFITSNCWAVSYYNKQYFVSCGTSSSSRLRVISTSTLNPIKTIIVPSEPREVVFIQNGTVMVVALLNPDTIGFYDVSSTNTYTLTSTIIAPGSPYSMYCVNDDLLLVVMFNTLTPIYTLQNTNGGSGWTWSPIPATTSLASTIDFQSTFDVCGRMWVSVRGYGIRIFDATGSQSLYNWPLTNGLNGILLTETFDLYTADYLFNQVAAYLPGIQQCTS